MEVSSVREGAFIEVGNWLAPVKEVISETRKMIVLKAEGITETITVFKKRQGNGNPIIFQGRPFGWSREFGKRKP